MKIKEVLQNKSNASICTICPGQTVGAAVAELCRNGIGALLVVNERREPVGIITERDVLRAASRDLKGFSDLRVSEVMSKDLICGLPDDEVHYVMQVITQNRIRHLPIVENNRLVGVVSIGDMIKSQLEAVRVENHMLKDYLHLKGEI
ncbi:MAG TPA: CBS domain-containing protein [Phycisphaerae bacterium]|nr:CBS domain-containing protein [Phycisphaerae bacterium]